MNLEKTEERKNLEVTDLIKSTLLESAKWAKLLAIIGFIGVGLMVIMGFFMGTIMSSLGWSTSYSSDNNPFEAIGGVVLAVIYIGMALIYYFPIKYLYDYASKVKQAIIITNQELFTEALVKLKAHYRYIGILMIVIFALYAFLIFVTLIGLIFASASL